MNFRLVRLIDKYIGIPLAYIIFFLYRLFSYFSQDTPFDIHKILLIKFWGIGNIIMLLPAAKALQEKYPSARIDILTLTNNKDVSEATKVFNRIYTINTQNIAAYIKTSLKVFMVLRRKNYDLIIDFEQFARFSALFCALIGRKKTVGFNTHGQHREFLFTNSIPYNNHIHMVKSFFSLVNLTGVGHKDYLEPVRITCGEQNKQAVLEFLHERGVDENDILIVFHTGTSENFSLRQWPSRNFAELANRLVDNYGVKIIFTGLEKENYLVKKAMMYMDKEDCVINTCGKFSFNEFVSLINLSDLVVSADTSAVHVASCLSTPVVGLYGPNTPVLYGPWGKDSIWFYKNLPCSPCITNYNAKINKCRHPDGQGACMKQISVDEVFSGIKDSYFTVQAPYRIKKLTKK